MLILSPPRICDIGQTVSSRNKIDPVLLRKWIERCGSKVSIQGQGTVGLKQTWWEGVWGWQELNGLSMILCSINKPKSHAMTMVLYSHVVRYSEFPFFAYSAVNILLYM